MRILIIEDNPKTAGFLQQGLVEQGHAVDVAATGRDGEERASEQVYDALVLDVMLPDEDGLQVCRHLRRRGVTAPILMLTALSTTADKVAGLDAGADDYLTKPFEFDEFVARIRALLRRGQAREADRLRCADLEMDLLARSVTRSGTRIRLTAKEFALLDCFLRNQDRVLTRTVIARHVWDMNFDSDSNVIDVYVSMLRRKVDKGFERRLIHTVVGAGYTMSARRSDP